MVFNDGKKIESCRGSVSQSPPSYTMSRITWSHPSFNWPLFAVVDGKEINLDAKELNSPQPCSHGMNCTYKKAGAVCAFVHPGEEGVGRHYFPARITDDVSKKIWQPPCVRLIGTKEKPCGFYERRRLGLTWPEWCAKKGIQIPKKTSQPQLVAPPPPQLVAPPVMPVMPAMPVGPVMPAMPAMPVGPMSPEMMAYLYQVAHAQKHAQALAYAKQMEEAKAILARNHMGNMLFTKVASYLDGLKALNAGDAEFVWPENITPGKITGMFLEGMPLTDLQQLIDHTPSFEEKVGEALDILNTVWEREHPVLA